MSESASAVGRIHSFQSLGTLDGPGVRFVVFMQGCHLRCGCCHNPDTWDVHGGCEHTAEDVLDRILRCRAYFGKDGGVTVSGGEPLLQTTFVRRLFSLCKQEGIHTRLDTSGSILTEDVKALLDVTDRVLLDVKYTDPGSYKRYVGCDMDRVLAFLSYLDGQHIPTTVRQVIIPTLNDTEEHISALKTLVDRYACVDKVELLPFKKICSTKYDNMGIPFPFEHLPAPAKADMRRLENLLNT